MSLNKQNTISGIVRAIIKNHWHALITFALVLILVSVTFPSWPRKYGSEGRLFVQLGRTGTGLDTSLSTSPISTNDARQTEIRSIVEMVKSRAIIGAVVEKIGAEDSLKNPVSDFFNFDYSPSSVPWHRDNTTGQTDRKQVNRAKQQIAERGVDVLGMVVKHS